MVDPLGVAGIAAADDLVDEAAVGGEIIEVGSAAQ
ncbi:dihydroorotate dehydrogenase [Bradyrhizobium sp. USDA 4524]|nr:dihydroorotate dehydrogenase [Bradyrhizobium sp. USDA 4538]MCP1907230.1 dihydroorotate dehydrogenase [Bradyrhizobium sp. USDA 4537]MCP1985706.1 dihydroorotate dehydrogenase [Bradyrhizobium sp. USDA 4539]